MKRRNAAIMANEHHTNTTSAAKVGTLTHVPTTNARRYIRPAMRHTGPIEAITATLTKPQHPHKRRRETCRALAHAAAAMPINLHSLLILGEDVNHATTQEARKTAYRRLYAAADVVGMLPYTIRTAAAIAARARRKGVWMNPAEAIAIAIYSQY